MLVKKGTIMMVYGLFLQRDWIINVHRNIRFSGQMDLKELEEAGLVTVTLGKRNYSLKSLYHYVINLIRS